MNVSLGVEWKLTPREYLTALGDVYKWDAVVQKQFNNFNVLMLQCLQQELVATQTQVSVFVQPTAFSAQVKLSSAESPFATVVPTAVEQEARGRAVQRFLSIVTGKGAEIVKDVADLSYTGEWKGVSE